MVSARRNAAANSNRRSAHREDAGRAARVLRLGSGAVARDIHHADGKRVLGAPQGKRKRRSAGIYEARRRGSVSSRRECGLQKNHRKGRCSKVIMKSPPPTDKAVERTAKRMFEFAAKQLQIPESKSLWKTQYMTTPRSAWKAVARWHLSQMRKARKP